MGERTYDYELSELTPIQLLKAFRYYSWCHFYKYEFTEWMKKECSVTRNAQGEIDGIYYIAKSGLDNILSYSVDENVITLLKEKL